MSEKQDCSKVIYISQLGFDIKCYFYYLPFPWCAVYDGAVGTMNTQKYCILGYYQQGLAELADSENSTLIRNTAIRLRHYRYVLIIIMYYNGILNSRS